MTKRNKMFKFRREAIKERNERYAELRRERAAKKSKNLPTLEIRRKNGKRAKGNPSVTMGLKTLRRIISGARTGRKVKAKVRVH